MSPILRRQLDVVNVGRLLLQQSLTSRCHRSLHRHAATPELWTETYLSALLRAIRYADDASYRLAGYRKLDPITTPAVHITVEVALDAVGYSWPNASKSWFHAPTGNLTFVRHCKDTSVGKKV